MDDAPPSIIVTVCVPVGETVRVVLMGLCEDAKQGNT